MLARLAWRNLWRNRIRSWIVIGSVAIGTLGLIVITMLTEGLLRQMVRNVIDGGTGHLQIHPHGYLQDPDVRKRIARPDVILRQLSAMPAIARATPRVVLQGVISSPYNSAPVQIVGGDPAAEREITFFTRYIVRGRFPEHRTEALIGRELAHHLNVDLGERIVLTGADRRGELVSVAVRVSGWVHTPIRDLNRYFVFVPIDVARELAGYRGEATLIVVRLHRDRDVRPVVAAVRHFLPPTLDVTPWDAIHPEIRFQLEIFAEFNWITALIVFLAAALGVMNVFYMAVYERMREFGILRAIGMQPQEIRRLIYFEAMWLSLIGLSLGFLGSLGIYALWNVRGLNLARLSRAMEAWGTGAVIYPSLSWGPILEFLGVLFVCVFLAVWIPARRATRISVVEAMQHV